MTEKEREWVRGALKAERQLGVADGVLRSAERTKAVAQGFILTGDEPQARVAHALSQQMLADAKEELARGERLAQDATKLR